MSVKRAEASTAPSEQREQSAAKAAAQSEQSTATASSARKDRWKDSTDLTRADVDGWFNPTVAKMKEQAIEGQILNYMSFQTRNGLREVVVIKLAEPLTVAVKEDVPGAYQFAIGAKNVKVVDLPAGKNVALGISAELTDLLLYVEHKGECLVWPKELRKMANGNDVWKYGVKVKGKKGARPIPTRTEQRDEAVSSSSTADDDDIPF